MAGGYSAAFVASVGQYIFAKGFAFNFRRSHPHFVQIYGAASSAGTHATIFHDGLCNV
jgi:hypothetical protein